MARRQTLVQLDDSLLSLLDERAARSGVSRSALIRTAISAYLAEEHEAAIDAAILAGYERIPAEENDPWAHASAIRSIQAEPW